MTRFLLKDTNPDLFAQLVDSDETLSARTSRKVRWRCEMGHEWDATVHSRVNGAGCPYCSGRRRIVGVNDLATTHPDLAAQLVDGRLATELAPHSARKVRWRCEHGHEWVASVVSRTQGNGCPVCSNKLVIPGVNDLATTHPDLAAECIDQEAVRHVSYGSTKRLRWRCKNGHEWNAAVENRAIQHQGCPVCAKSMAECRKHAGGARIVAGVNDFPTLFPALAAELVHPESAVGKGRSSREKLLWRCSHGHEWMASIYARVHGHGCHVCNCGCVTPGVNDLATRFPNLSLELLNADDAVGVSPYSRKKLFWCCAHGHVWKATPASRVSGAGCPVCSGRRVARGFNDLWTTDSVIAGELVNSEDGYKVSRGSERMLWWRCPNGHVYEMSSNHRVNLGQGCPVCSGRRVVSGVNDLATTHPDIASQLVDQTIATKVSFGSGTVVEWRCEHGHVYSMSVASRVRDSKTCPVCSGHRCVEGINDLDTIRPDLASELVDRSLAKYVTCGSGRYVDWRCAKGHTWKARVVERCGLHATGCPVCNPGRVSKIEREVADVVESMVKPYGIEVYRNVSGIIGRSELDIVIPSKHVAIEFNGCYWHSEAAGKDRHYHEDKYRAARDAGYTLISVWEDTWRKRRDVVVRMLASKLGICDSRRIFARACEFAMISGHDAAAFMERNHIQGAVRATRHFALMYEGEPVAVMSVRSPRASGRMRREAGEWEIVRYATAATVVGGFSKLLAHAERKLVEGGETLVRWVSFSDNEVSDGHMYEVCGFTLDAELEPDYHYWGMATGYVRAPKEAYQKRKFRERNDLVFEEGKSERELAEMNGLVRLWDCGKRRWVKKVLVQ